MASSGRKVAGKWALLVLGALLLSGISAGHGGAEESIFVTNFPEVQKTRDVNSIPRTILKKFESIEVGRFSPSEVIDLSDKKYIIDTDGYTEATVSMFGFPKSTGFSDCKVGVVLLPNEDSIWRAWREDRAMILYEEVSASVSDRHKYFDAQIEIDLHFPSYMVGFYNTCGSNVEVSLYSYLK